MIVDNVALDSLKGLDHLRAGSISVLVIENNPALSGCAIGSICYFLADGGTASISGNAFGCISAEEVHAQCIFDATNDPVDESGINVYPNPTSSTLE